MTGRRGVGDLVWGPLRGAWGRRDCWAVVAWVEAALAILSCLVVLLLVLRFGEDAVAFLLGYPPLRVVVTAFVLLCFGTGLWWLASQDEEVVESALRLRAVLGARSLRWAFVLVAPVAVWSAWPRLPHFHRSDTISIAVARLPEAGAGRARVWSGWTGQRALVRAIGEAAAGDRSLKGRLLVEGVDALIPVDDAGKGTERVRRLGRRLGADLVVWGSGVSREGSIYSVRVSSGRDAPAPQLSESEIHLALIGEPAQPQLEGEVPRLARFVLGYACYDRGQFAQAARLLSKVQMPASSDDAALLAFYLATCDAVQGMCDPALSVKEVRASLQRAASGYEKVLATWGEATPPGARAAAHNNLAVSYYALWVLNTIAADADRLIKLAHDHYQAAASLLPGSPLILSNWGRAFAGQAYWRGGSETAARRSQAITRYQAALAVDPGCHQALYDWGLLLYQQSGGESGDRAERLLGQALHRYQAAVAARPDCEQALIGWGNVLREQASAKPAGEANQLYEQACRQYRAAYDVDPRSYLALTEWGLAISWQASQGSQQTFSRLSRLSAQALVKHEAAFALKPDSPYVLWAWGDTLQCGSRLEEAIGKYRAALVISPDYYTALNSWGWALFNLANATKPASRRDQLLREATEKYRAALAIRPDFDGALTNWALALNHLALRVPGDNKTDAERVRLFTQAEEKYRAVAAIDPGPMIFGDWAYTLSNHADLAQGAEKERLLGEAIEKCQAGFTLDPSFDWILEDWAHLLKEQAKLRTGAEAEVLLLRAREKAIEGYYLRPATGHAYNAACYSARLGEEQECRRWLARAKQSGGLPAPDFMRSDSDLKSVRDKDWFQVYLRR